MTATPLARPTATAAILTLGRSGRRRSRRSSRSNYASPSLRSASVTATPLASPMHRRVIAMTATLNLRRSHKRIQMWRRGRSLMKMLKGLRETRQRRKCPRQCRGMVMMNAATMLVRILKVKRVRPPPLASPWNQRAATLTLRRRRRRRRICGGVR